MRTGEKALFVLSALAIAAAAYATETITYTYDARGRLVKVERTGMPMSATTPSTS